MRDLKSIQEKRLPNQYEVAGSIVHYDACFLMVSPVDGRDMMVIASVGHGWDHVSVSKQARIPTWTDMEYVKRKLFKDDEVAMQLHVPPKNHINCHPNCLHLWRPQNGVIPVPPEILV